MLQPGTRRTYDAFARCGSCQKVYWRGAHFGRLDAIVQAALLATGAPWTSAGPA